MSDLEVIEQLKEYTFEKIEHLEQFDIDSYYKIGYVLDGTKVVGLSLYQCHLKAFPIIITALKKLKKLGLSSNEITSIPTEIDHLQNLEELWLNDNKIEKLPKGISSLTSLKQLWLNDNKIEKLPEEILSLSNLRELWLNNNALRELPTEISRLEKLTHLYFANNKIQFLPEKLCDLPYLVDLDVRNNQLTALPNQIDQLRNLRYLNFSNNSVKELPQEIKDLNSYCQLEIEDNDFQNLPIEIATMGTEAIRNYYEQLSKGEELVYEAKILIVGEGEAGKTSLANKILNPEYELSLKEPSTQGIDILTWQFPVNDGHNFKANIWDFGGQEIYHATHQFFLTKRSLYVLVADTRKDNANFEYWLQIIELLSDKSPVVIIKNEKQDRQCEINESRLKGRFGNLKECIPTNLATNRNLDNVLKELKRRLQDLFETNNTKLPKSWMEVRRALEKKSRNQISLKDFLDICDKYRDEQEDEQQSKDKEQLEKELLEYGLLLSEHLHNIGVCLHFQDDPLLKHIVILNPEWCTNAVYKVLDNEKVKKNLGRFTKYDLYNIWQAMEYSNMHDELLQLMMKFKLCYKLDYCDTYIAPQILPIQPPNGYRPNSQNNTILRYQYEFMPKGMMTQFIVTMHEYIEDRQQCVWREGVVLNRDNTRAEVIEKYRRREIIVKIQGNMSRELAYLINFEWEKIHNNYHHLKYKTLIPCNCEKCKGSSAPYFYELSVLNKFINDGESKIQCQKSYKMMDVRKLIGYTFSQEYEPEKQLKSEKLYPSEINIYNNNHSLSHSGDMQGSNNNLGDNVEQQVPSLTPDQLASIFSKLPIEQQKILCKQIQPYL